MNGSQEMPGHIQQILEEFEGFGSIALPEKHGHRFGTGLHQGDDLVQFGGHIGCHVIHGYRLEFNPLQFAAVNIFGLVRVYFAEKFIIDQHVGNNMVFLDLVFHYFDQNFLKVGKIAYFERALTSVNNYHDAPPTPSKGKILQLLLIICKQRANRRGTGESRKNPHKAGCRSLAPAAERRGKKRYGRSR